MPIRTKMLDQGNFVHSPERPWSEAFAAYLHGFDSLFAQWQAVQRQSQQSPFSPELLEQKKGLEAKVAEYLAPHAQRYTLRQVEQDRTFLPLGRFLEQCRPLREAFSVLHCEAAIPLHTVARFQGYDDLRRLNDALNQRAPLPWWQHGPMGHPCYLFGECVWELRPSELHASDKGLLILFEETLEKDRQKWDRLRRNVSASAADPEFIPEGLRVGIWRRAGGKCMKCGGRQQLDFSYLTPQNRGGTATAENIQLLCARCRTKE
jgi:hypothetical protein